MTQIGSLISAAECSFSFLNELSIRSGCRQRWQTKDTRGEVEVATLGLNAGMAATAPDPEDEDEGEWRDGEGVVIMERKEIQAVKNT